MISRFTFDVESELAKVRADAGVANVANAKSGFSQKTPKNVATVAVSQPIHVHASVSETPKNRESEPPVKNLSRTWIGCDTATVATLLADSREKSVFASATFATLLRAFVATAMVLDPGRAAYPDWVYAAYRLWCQDQRVPPEPPDYFEDVLLATFAPEVTSGLHREGDRELTIYLGIALNDRFSRGAEWLLRGIGAPWRTPVPDDEPLGSLAKDIAALESEKRIAMKEARPANIVEFVIRALTEAGCPVRMPVPAPALGLTASSSVLPIVESPSSLVRGGSARQALEPFRGMAGLPGGGPSGRTCGQCRHWDGKLSKGEPAVRAARCLERRRMAMGRWGPPVSHTASACKYFAARERWKP
jgi:hypothetical protein